MGAETSPSAAASEPTLAQAPVPADHPGVAELFAVLAYGEISAFYRLAEDAKLSPTLRGRVALASMAAAEMSHFETLHEALEARGVEIYTAMEPFRRSLDATTRATPPSTWLESLVKAHVGDGIAADFYCEIAGTLAPEVASVVREVLAETGHSDFVVHEVRAAVEKSSLEKDRLMLWGRRLLGGGDHPGPVRDGAAGGPRRPGHHRDRRPDEHRRAVRPYAGRARQTDGSARTALT